MFEAKLLDGSILKRIVEAIKDVVNDVNIDVSPSGKHPTTPFPSFSAATPQNLKLGPHRLPTASQKLAA